MPSWEWEWEGIETGGGGRTMNAQECGMPPRRAAPQNCPPSCFSTSLRPRPRPPPKSPSGPTTDHCTSLHGDLTTGSASSGPRQVQLNISGPDHSRTTCRRRLSRASSHAFGAALRLTARVGIANVRVCGYCVCNCEGRQSSDRTCKVEMRCRSLQSLQPRAGFCDNIRGPALMPATPAHQILGMGTETGSKSGLGGLFQGC